MKRPVIRIALGIILVIVLCAVTGIRVTHPQSGLKNGLGSAKSGVVLYRKSTQSTIGSKIIVNFSKPHVSPVLASVIKNEKNSVQIQTGTNLESVKVEQIQGKLLLMIPFFGQLATLFGL